LLGPFLSDQTNCQVIDARQKFAKKHYFDKFRWTPTDAIVVGIAEIIFRKYAYSVVSGETEKFTGFSVSYLKMAQNLKGKPQHIVIHHKTGLSSPPHLTHADRHIRKFV